MTLITAHPVTFCTDPAWLRSGQENRNGNRYPEFLRLTRWLASTAVLISPTSRRRTKGGAGAGILKPPLAADIAPISFSDLNAGSHSIEDT